MMGISRYGSILRRSGTDRRIDDRWGSLLGLFKITAELPGTGSVVK
jgi:hypothetical protein